MIKTVASASIFRRVILEYEAKIGSKLFEPAENQNTKEFYYAGNNFWIWSCKNQLSSPLKEATTYYKIENNRIIKSKDGVSYILVGRNEAINLLRAAREYKTRVVNQVYMPIVRNL